MLIKHNVTVCGVFNTSNNSKVAKYLKPVSCSGNTITDKLKNITSRIPHQHNEHPRGFFFSICFYVPIDAASEA
jgi:hypothetical protein